MQYLGDNTKEKSMAEEMKNTYGNERGSWGIIINRISEPVTRLANGFQNSKEILQGRSTYRSDNSSCTVREGDSNQLDPILNLFL
jgi:hypothetical protein